MKYLFLIAAFNAFFFLVLLLQKKPKYFYDKILITWLIYLGSYTGLYALFSHEFFDDFPVLSVSFISLLMLHGPFMFLYISAYTSRVTKLRRVDYLHFLPVLLFNIFLLLSHLLNKSSGISLSHEAGEVVPPFLFNFFLIVTALSGPVYFLLSIRLFRKLDEKIRNNYSFSKDIDLGWLRKVILVFGIVWSLFIIAASLYHVLHLFSMNFCTDGLFFSMTVFIILTGYFGLKQKGIFIHHFIPEQDFISDPPKKYSGSYLKENDAKEYSDKLLQYMVNTRPYLNADLTLPQLSHELHIPSHLLSQVINDNLKLNFFDFVNSYRIEEVKKKIIDPAYKNYSLLGIAFESGFNSKSAFNRIFKKLSGLTPTQFKISKEF